MLGTTRDSEMSGACDLGKQAPEMAEVEGSGLGGAGVGRCKSGARKFTLGKASVFGAVI